MQIKKVTFKKIHSTNSYAKEHIDTFDPKYVTIISAEEQTAGRGRFQRKWISPKDCNLYLTYVFFKPKLDETIGQIPQLLALALCDVLRPIVPEVSLKWPNDIVIQNRKLGGILTETSESRGMWGIIVGIGINVNMDASYQKMIDRPCTSLLIETGEVFNREELSEALHQRFFELLKRGFSSNLDSLKKAFIHKKGDWLKTNDFVKIVEGQFEQINQDGSLTLRLENGDFCKINSGELL